MSLANKLKMLTGLYDLLDQHLASLPKACEKGCAACCTCNVSATTLEAWPLYLALTAAGNGAWQRALINQQQLPRYQPTVTLNDWARRCLDEKSECEAAPNPGWGACPLLTDSNCPRYEARPLACRVMLSARRCRPDGEAQMDPFAVALSNIFGQVIEHLDSGGLNGNLTDLLLFFKGHEQCRSYAQGEPLAPTGSLLANQPMPALMIAPEHRRRAQPILAAINKLMAG
jgi:Fe-S-cluster containining protein